jgi:hypothetical protein
MEKNLLETLEVTNEFIINIIEKLVDTATSFQSSDDSQGFNKLILVIDDLLLLNEALESINTSVNEQIFNMNIINNILIEFNEALENNDIVMISDLLEYEVKPFLDMISDNINGIIKGN